MKPLANRIARLLPPERLEAARRALQRIHSPREWLAWGVFVLAFTVVVGTLLVRSHGLPYGLDNNESFSNITHARAIANYGVIKSLGLTDETAATHQGASPYIHSHQGNFPRFFAFCLYFLGAKSIERQIWLTTFSIGLSAFWFAFAYLARRTNPVFALLACLVLLADYLLVMQWHVNTYRVWHAWFFFAVLWFIDRGDQPRSRWRTFFGILLFAALFYWEYVFGFFLGILAALYSCLVHWRSPRLWLRLWGVEIIGGVFAIVVLLTQLTLYMGWSNVLLDIQYTLQARNSVESQVLTRRITDFYDKYHVLFWPNYADASSLRHASRLVDSFLHDHLQYYTPPLVMLMLWIGGGWLVGLLDGRRPGTATRKPFIPPALTGVVNWLLVCGLGYAITRPYFKTDSLTTGFIFLASAALLSLAALVLRKTGFRWSQLSPIRLAGLWLLFAGIYGVCSIHFAHEGMFADIWDASTGITGSAIMAVSAAGMVLAATLGVAGAQRLLGPTPRENLSGMVPLFVATLVGYIPTYWIFAGYLFSGYLYRQAPFLVFTTDLALTLVIYVSGRVGWMSAARLRAVCSSDRGRAGESRLPRIGRTLAALGGVTLAVLVGGVACFGWIQVQRNYTRLVPIDSHVYFQDLAKAPFKGRSFAVNTYASPVSVQTGSWAMMEPVFFTGRITLTPRGYEAARENTYKWFADRETNPAYLKPEFAIVQRPGGWSDISYSYQSRQDQQLRKFNLRDVALIGRAALPFTRFLHPKIVAIDDSERQSFAIVEMDWDYPAYLAALRRDLSPLFKFGRASLDAMGTSGEADWRIRVDAMRLKEGQHITLHCIQTPLQTVDLPSILVKDPAWAVVPGSGALRTTTFPAVLAVEANGPTLDLEFQKGPEGGHVHVRVNEVEAVLDLYARSPTIEICHFESRTGEDGAVTMPRTVPGQFAAVDIHDHTATLTYAYRHQEGAPEAQTLVNVYRQNDDGLWQLQREFELLGKELRPVDSFMFRMENPDTLIEYRRSVGHDDTRSFPEWLIGHLAANPSESTRAGLQPIWDGTMTATGDARIVRLQLPKELDGTLRIGVLPGTGRKLGPEYFSNPFSVAEPNAVFGLVRMRLRLPGEAGSDRQPLLVCGSAVSGSLVYLQYVAANRICIGINAGRHGVLVSPPFDIDPQSEQTLEISHGSLYPLPDHPKMQTLNQAVQASLRRFVRIVWNNEPVIEADLPLPPINYRAVKFGQSTGFPETAGRFAGEILSVERHWPESFVPYDHLSKIQATQFGPLSFEVRFPAGLAGRSEPLVTSGVTGAGDFLYVRYVDDRHIRLGFDHWGVKGYLGEPIEIEPDHWYRLTLSMGSLYPPEGDFWFSGHDAATGQIAKSRVLVFLDDREIFSADSPAYESLPRFVKLGENDIGGSTTGPAFSGAIRDAKRLPFAEFPFINPAH